MNKRVLITGGIGSGKSVVCRILASLGFPIYDCDTRAKRLMDADQEIICEIRDKICAKAVRPNLSINRDILSKVIFSDTKLRERLNSLIHSRVCEDFERWSKNRPLSFVESAIPFTSGLYDYVDSAVIVTAPLEIRVNRIMVRNPNLSRKDIIRRIESQRVETVPDNVEHYTIINDSHTGVLKQTEHILDTICHRD